MTPKERQRITEMVERLAREIAAEGTVSYRDAFAALAIEHGLSHGCIVNLDEHGREIPQDPDAIVDAALARWGPRT